MRILYIDIDSLRPDHLGCYGYHRQTSPHIDAIAAEGVRFTNCYASDSPCLPSRTALFGGRFGIQTGVVNHGGTNADPRLEGPGRGFRSSSTNRSLAENLRRVGWYTASISPFPHRHSAYQIWEGFHEMFDTGADGHEGAQVVFPRVKRWLEQNGSLERWFLHVNFWDPHTPYDVPLENGHPFAKDPPPAWLTQELIERQRASYGPHDAVSPHGMLNQPFNWPRGAATIANLHDWRRWIDGYDTGIHYCDRFVGRIVEKLKDLGLYEETAILVSADHGENQGELEVYGDHQTADQQTHRIPLLIRWPGLTQPHAGRAFQGLRYHLDLAPTLVELAGGNPPQAWDGRSFAAALQDGGDRGREFLILSQGAWSCQRSARWDDYLLIRTLHTGGKNFPSLMLFDLQADPYEQHNLAQTRPDLTARGLQLMEGWVKEQLARSGRPDPLEEVMAEGGPFHFRECREELCRHLRETARGRHADWLQKYGGRPREG